jgi:tRNA1Val (adenine37-N6)-methyltransferase
VESLGPRQDETLDSLFQGKLKILQKRSGYRFSMDPVLLVYFAANLRGKRVLDLGTGCGVIPMILAHKGDVLEAFGLELQEELVEMAGRSVKLNGLGGKVKILQGDFRCIRDIFPPQSFDHVLSNPPYHDPGEGRRSPKRQKALSRHEEEGSIEELVEAAKYVLGTKGRLWLTYSPSRLSRLMRALGEGGFVPVRLRFVHGRAELPARMCLLEAVRGGKGALRVEPPLILYRQARQYTRELQEVYQ